MQDRVVDVLRQDFTKNPLLDSRITLVIWRLGQALSGRPGTAAFLARRLVRAGDVCWTRAYVGADLPPQVAAGPGLRLPHGGRGVVLHPSVRIGAGVTLYHRVTVGVRDDRSAGTIGDGAYIGVGAAILGPVSLGADCRIGANAVVVRDIPPGATAVGVPAEVVKTSRDVLDGDPP